MVQHSSLDLQAGDFSQVPGSSCSLSLPSEPPDIRNWFSSYVYESPALDTGDVFRSSFLGGIECENKGFDVEDSNKEEEANFGGLEKTGKGALKGLVKGDSDVGDDKEEKQCAEIPGSSYSLSLPSEPPDIRIWFSSYTYESPVLDTSDDFRCPVPRESECEKEGLTLNESNREEEENLGKFRPNMKKDEVVFGEKIASNGFVRCKRSVRDNQNDNQSLSKGTDGFEGNKNPPAQNNSCSTKNSEQCLERKTLQTHNFSPVKDFKRSTLNNENIRWEQEAKFSSKGDPALLITDNNSGTKQPKSPKKLHNRRDFLEERSEDKVHTEKLDAVTLVDGVSTNKSARGCSDKENGQALAENGFISTRKSRSTARNDINSLKRQQEFEFVCMRSTGKVYLPGENDAVVQRKVLSEMTNFQCSKESEIAGKWRCPQKSKPNLGPPLKQLRLERWINRA